MARTNPSQTKSGTISAELSFLPWYAGFFWNSNAVVWRYCPVSDTAGSCLPKAVDLDVIELHVVARECVSIQLSPFGLRGKGNHHGNERDQSTASTGAEDTAEGTGEVRGKFLRLYSPGDVTCVYHDVTCVPPWFHFYNMTPRVPCSIPLQNVMSLAPTWRHMLTVNC